MTSVKTPDHGTQSRYKGSRHGNWEPCRCQPCRAAHNRACHIRALAHLSGQPPLFPGEPLVAHIQCLEEAGMSRDLIARRANVSHSTIKYIVQGRTKRCRRPLALRILAVTADDFDERARHPTLGSQRRVQALYAMGHNHETIGAAANLSASSVSKLANGRHQYLDARTVDVVRAAYTQLAAIPGTSAKARSRAKAEGWAGPAYWDEDDFENPDFVPAIDEGKPLKQVEVTHLTRCGIRVEEIQARTGASLSYIRGIRAEILTGQRRDRTAHDKAA